MRNFLLIGLVLLLCAFCLAVWQLQRLQDRISALEAETKQLRAEAEHPTQFIGKFPDNISEVTKMVNATTSSLLIVNDYCAYGHYSKPDAYQEYKNALIALAKKNVSVDMYIYDDATILQANASQFGTDFNKISSDAKFKNYFDYYKNDHERRQPNDLASYNKFMAGEQQRCIRELSVAGVKIHQSIHSILPVFIWLRDQDEGIVSMYNLGEDAREVSLLTKNRSLLTVLGEISIQARQKAIDEKNEALHSPNRDPTPVLR